MFGTSKLRAIYYGSLMSLIITVGCAPQMRINVTRPAEINLKDTKQVAVGDITGTNGQDVYDDLVTALMNSGRFEVLDRQNLAGLMREKNFTLSGQVDETQAAVIGQMLGAGALVFGRVAKYEYGEKLTRRDWTDKEGGAHVTVTRLGKAEVTVNLQVTDISSGRILTKAPIRSAMEKKESATDEMPAEIDKDGLLSLARANVIATFMKKIAPYQETVTISFKKSKQAPEVSQGIAMAKGGQVDRALEIFEKAAQAHPSDPAVLFDYAVALELNGRFADADSAYMKASSIKSDKQILAAMTRNKQRATDERKLKEQGVESNAATE